MGANWQGQCDSHCFEMVWIFDAATLQRTAESIMLSCSVFVFLMSPVLNLALDHRFLRALQEHRGSFRIFLCTKANWLAGVSFAGFALANGLGAEAGLEV